MTPPPVRHDPPYALSAPAAPATAPLAGAERADVALVGAGFSGLVTAITLARRGMRVLLLEADEVGSGGSGRNHGQCIPVYGYLDEAELPPEGFALLRDSGRQVFDWIGTHGIECEAVQKGTLAAAHNARGLDALRATHAKYHRLGKAGAFLGTDEVTERTGIPGYLGGWVHEDGGHVNPLAYARGLARVAGELGVRICTRSPVTGLSRRDGAWILRTPGGEVTAPRVGLTANGYATPDLPARLRGHTFPMLSYAVASTPLTSDQRAAVMPSGMNFHDTHHDPMFFRVDAAGRIITGGLVELRRGRNAAATFAIFERRLRGLYPVLAGLDFGWHWAGRLSIALRKRPAILELDDGLWGLCGYSGRGVPTSAALGQCLAATLADPAEGARLWPAERPGRVLAPHALGLAVQSLRGPLNKLRDRIEG